jgi:hypothetical protein
MQLRVAEQYIREFGNLARESNTIIMPANVTDVASMIASAMTVIRQSDGAAPAAVPARAR